MTATQDPLFGARRRRGVSRSQLDRTLTAWRKAGTLSGDEFAALRSTLRDAAEAVDAARAALRDPDGKGSPYTLSMCVRVYADLLRQAVEGGEQGDALDDLLAAFSDAGATVRDDT